MKFVFSLIAAALLCFAAASVNAQTVGGSISTVSRGGSGRGSVVLNIPGGLHVVSSVTIESECGDKPCCVAETVARMYA